MKSLVLIFLAVCIFSGVRSQGIENLMAGKWLSKDKESILLFEKQSNQWVGVLSWLKDSTDSKGQPYLDDKNSPPSLKTKEIVGLEILFSIKILNEMATGTYYDIESGESYPCTITIKSNKMTIRVCDSFGWFCENEVLTKLPNR
jgi:uncharacterized protein (DUF2147 family)